MNARRRRKKRDPKALKRIGVLLALLIALYALLWIITPSVEEYYGISEEGTSIAGLEIPLLQEGDVLIIHTGFSLVYEEEHEMARWVAYELTRDEIYGLHQRRDNFRIDPNISTGSATLADYRNSGYDRGHLIPAADLPWSEEAMSDSFYMSNMTPQVPSFNRGIWASLEAVVRNFAATEGSVYVVTGPVLTDGPFDTIGENRVSIPNHFFKVVLDYTEPELKAIGFILPNEGSTKDLREFATSVNHVQQITQIDFFPLLPDDIEEILESTFDVNAWDFSEFRATREERIQYAQERLEGIPYHEEPSFEHTIKDYIDRIMVTMKREIFTLLGSFGLPFLLT